MHSENCLTETGYGTRICMQCGIEAHGGPFCKEPSFMYPRGHELTIRRKQPYTRAKRFRKYLMRACMSQRTGRDVEIPRVAPALYRSAGDPVSPQTFQA